MPCDGGTTCRDRTCSNPIPQNGGKECVGGGQECKDCNTISCKGKQRLVINFLNIFQILLDLPYK